MSNSDDLSGSEPGLMIERDEIYEHEDHGRVEVTGIWKGVHQIDSARNATESGVVIVRYAIEEIGETVELTDTLDEFLESIE